MDPSFLSSELLEYGISVLIARTARDLGVCLNPGSRRSTAGIQAYKRMGSAGIRLVKTAGLVKIPRGARKLVTTGSFLNPCGVMFPKEFPLLLLISLGPRLLPLPWLLGRGVTLPRGLPGSKLAPGWVCGKIVPICVPTLGRLGFTICNGRVFGEQWPGWNKVTGPMTATMATLHTYGWKARCPDLWVGPGGQNRAIVFGSGIKGIATSVADSVSRHLWKVASLFWCGGGLASGVALPVGLAPPASLACHKYRNSAGHSPGRLAMLEAFLSGGYGQHL